LFSNHTVSTGEINSHQAVDQRSTPPETAVVAAIRPDTAQVIAVPSSLVNSLRSVHVHIRRDAEKRFSELGAEAR